jgi:chemotaxis protein CheD
MSALPIATNHYFDSHFGRPGVKLLPNEFYTTSDDIVLMTVLGSCVAACLHDPYAGIGGMNHFMLPDDGADPSAAASESMRYGAYAMEVLINELIKAGADRTRLEAKVFGGGAVLAAMQQMNIGERNGIFVLNYLKTEGVPVRAQDLGDVFARRVNYFPRSGKVMVRRMEPHHHKGEILIAKRDEVTAEVVKAEAEAPTNVQRFKTTKGGMKIERFT